jgi:shikimate dehydrogenase
VNAVALIGDPVAQSPSPAMHRAGFEALGLSMDYRALRVTARSLPQIFPSLSRRFLGLNVTRPLKEAVVPLLDEVSPGAKAAGSVNTVAFRNGRAEGHSTDGSGFLAALRRAGVGTVEAALILGTGGAARAVGAALAGAGARVMVSGRNPEAGDRLAADLGVTFVPTARLAGLLGEANLLVNATPVGGWPDPTSCPLPEGTPLEPGLIVFDLVYRPRRTVLLDRASSAGCLTIEGAEMLVEQGVGSFRIWTGLEPPVEVMRRAALDHLDDRSPQEPAEARVGPDPHGGGA